MDNSGIKKLIENNLDYAELLLVPEETSLELINKDAGLGKIDNRQQSQLNAWFNSLHKIQTFTKPVAILVKLQQKENGEILQIPINPREYTLEQLQEALKEGSIKQIIKEMPRYPSAFHDLKSRISSMLITSGSLDGFRATLQHSTFTKQEQKQTLEEIQGLQKNKSRGKRK